MTRNRVLAALASLVLVAALHSPAKSAEAAGLPAFDHVFLIVMENHSYSEIIGNPAAPYINSLLPNAALAVNYHGVAHPSLPNYLALAGGNTYGITSDCTTCWVSARNIGDNLEAAGYSWKAYMESMPSPCFIGDSYPYAQKHNPFVYFNDIRTNTARCQAHDVPYSQLALDLQSAATTPRYGFITPNMCNDMHDCSVGTGDAWLQQQVPQLLGSPVFTSHRSLLAITWDEDDFTTSNQVPLLLLGGGVGTGAQSAGSYNHYSLLHSIENGLGLPTLTGIDAGAAVMSDLFNAPITSVPFVADFDGDGTADIAWVDGAGSSVRMSTGSAFNSALPWATIPFYGTKATLAGDVTGTGRASLVAVNKTQTFVLPSTGTAFGAPVVWSNAPFYGTRGTFLADVNGDGNQDLVAVNESSVWVMLSTGSGFGAPTLWSSTPFYGNVTTLTADLTGNGRADLIAVNGDSTWVMISTGSSFGPPTLWSSIPFFGSKATLAGDVTGSGRSDVIAVNGDSTWVLLSTGAGFGAPTLWSSIPFYGDQATFAGDVNGDKKADLIAVNASSVWVMTSSGAAYSAPALWG